MKIGMSRKICISIFVILVLTLLIHTKSFAKALNSMNELMSARNIGNTIKLSREGDQDGDKSRLRWNKYLYCFQHKKNCEPATYTVQAYVEIDGDKATRYTKNDATIGTNVTGNENLALGYILQYIGKDKNNNNNNYDYKRGWGNRRWNYSKTKSIMALWRYMDG